MKKEQKGITLVALVITIIILLILAGITIATLRDTDLFGQAKNAKNASVNATNIENQRLDEYEQAVQNELDELNSAQ